MRRSTQLVTLYWHIVSHRDRQADRQTDTQRDIRDIKQLFAQYSRARYSSMMIRFRSLDVLLGREVHGYHFSHPLTYPHPLRTIRILSGSAESIRLHGPERSPRFELRQSDASVHWFNRNNWHILTGLSSTHHAVVLCAKYPVSLVKLQQMRRIHTPCSKKGCRQTHGGNFVKSQPIFKILSPLETEGNFQ